LILKYLHQIWRMAVDEKFKVAKELIESGNLKTFRDIFLYVPKTEIAKRLGINYTRFLNLVQNPKRLRYEETYSIANILQVQAKTISDLVHKQIDFKKPDKARTK